MTEEEFQHCLSSDGLSVLVGRKVSELARIYDLRDDYRFLLSRKQEDGSYRSYAITYGNLVKQMTEEVRKALGIKSMAYRDRTEYAQVDHTHPYGYTVCNPTYQLSDFQDQGKVSCICTVTTSDYSTTGTVSVLYPPMPPTAPIRHRTPYVGEFRMFAELNGKTSSQIRQSMLDGTFDGWVYADGGSYPRTVGRYDFSEAYALYRGSGGTFSVPKIDNFLKLDGNPGQTVDCQTVHPYHNSVSSHTHMVVEADPVNSIAWCTVNLPVTIVPKESTRWTLHTGFPTEFTKFDISKAGLTSYPHLPVIVDDITCDNVETYVHTEIGGHCSDCDEFDM